MKKDSDQSVIAIIAGSRDLTDYKMVKDSIDKIRKLVSIRATVCGMAKGADLLGKRYSDENGIYVIECPAHWEVNGVIDRAAGYKRNTKMAVIADILILFWNGTSKGSHHMYREATRLGLPVYLIKYKIHRCVEKEKEHENNK